MRKLTDAVPFPVSFSYRPWLVRNRAATKFGKHSWYRTVPVTIVFNNISLNGTKSNFTLRDLAAKQPTHTCHF